MADERRYAEGGVWISKEGGCLVIGVTQGAVDKAKDVVLVELPEKGAKLAKGDRFASIESIKWSGHLALPIDGEVVEVNQEVADDPGLLNEDAGKHWLCKIRPKKPEAFEELSTKEQ